MRYVKNELRGTHIKIPANRPKGDAGIFMCVPLSSFLTFRIGSALQGVPWALPRPSEGPQGRSRTPRETPGAFLAAVASIFVSATFTWSKTDNLRLI